MQRLLLYFCTALLLAGISTIPAHAELSLNDIDLQDYLENRNYEEALKHIQAKKQDKLTAPESRILKLLNQFNESDIPVKTEGALAVTDDDMDADTVKQSNRIIRSAKHLILESKEDIAKEMLLYVIYIYPGNSKATNLLSLVYGLSDEDYKPYNVAKKLKSRSQNYFYGGNYLLAIKDLKVLAELDKKNPSYAEQLGSNYYMINEKKKAIDYWTASLFLNPSNTKLEDLIESTRTALIEEQKAESIAESSEKIAGPVIDDPQVMGVFKSQSDALTLLKKLRGQGLTVSTDEDDLGRVKVIVSRAELMEKNKG